MIMTLSWAGVVRAGEGNRTLMTSLEDRWRSLGRLVPGPDGSWLIVASANGAARNPAWYHNMAAPRRSHG
jgi:hypothetical protein